MKRRGWWEKGIRVAAQCRQCGITQADCSERRGMGSGLGLRSSEVHP